VVVGRGRMKLQSEVHTRDLCRGNFLRGLFSKFSCSLTPGPGRNTLFYL
jgi:hypothetical protein